MNPSTERKKYWVATYVMYMAASMRNCTSVCAYVFCELAAFATTDPSSKRDISAPYMPVKNWKPPDWSGDAHTAKEAEEDEEAHSQFKR